MKWQWVMLRDGPFPRLDFALEAAEAIAVNLIRMVMVQGRMKILEIGDFLEGNNNFHLDPAYSPISSLRLRIVSISSKKRGGYDPKFHMSRRPLLRPSPSSSFPHIPSPYQRHMGEPILLESHFAHHLGDL